jgi:hypothetical protein
MNHDAILNNQAGFDQGREPAAENHCDSCGEPLLFALQDKEHQFSMGLTSVLQCLRLAEEKGFVPKLPGQRWIDIKRSYRDVEV